MSITAPQLDRFETTPAGAGAVMDAVESTRAGWKLARDRLAQALADDAPISAALEAYREAIEALVLGAWAGAGLIYSGCTLAAAGGFGRGELFPYSDLDLLILLPEGGTPPHPGLERFLRGLWDAGFKLGHTVATKEQALELARADLTAYTSFLEARWLNGDMRRLELFDLALRDDRCRPAEAFVRAKFEELESRHARMGDAAFRLEPNLKEGPGGLRDLHTLLWVCNRMGLARRFGELLRPELLSPSEYEHLRQARDLLWRVRSALHLHYGRAEERLSFEAQKQLAPRLAGDNLNQAIERFMQRYFQALFRVRQLVAWLMQWWSEHLWPPAAANEPARVLSTAFEVCGDRLDLRQPRLLDTVPEIAIEACLWLAHLPDLDGLSANLMRACARTASRDAARLGRSPLAARLLLGILREPVGVTRSLRLLHRLGLLEAVLPEFARVNGLMQFDLFHIYPVDEHILLVVRNLRRFGVPAHTAQFELAGQIYTRLEYPEWLLLAGLFHDLGKGSGQDHSEAGARMLLEFARRAGLDPTEVADAEWLVRQHLDLSMTAQRCDLSDPETIRAFAQRVGSRRRLDLLYLLTLADVRATNPTLWNDWRASLFRQLYERAALYLGARQNGDRIERLKREALALLADTDPALVLSWWDTLPTDYFSRLDAGELAWQTRAVLSATDWLGDVILARDLPHVVAGSSQRAAELLVIGFGKPGDRFSATTLALDRAGLSVQQAALHRLANGLHIDHYRVVNADGDAPELPLSPLLQQASTEIRSALSPGAALPRPLNRRGSGTLRHFPVPLRIEFTHERRRQRTQLRVIAADRPGLLARIALAFADTGVVVQHALIATLGERVEDTFFIYQCEGEGKPCPLSEETLQQLEADLRTRLDS